MSNKEEGSLKEVFLSSHNYPNVFCDGNVCHKCLIFMVADSCMSLRNNDNLRFFAFVFYTCHNETTAKIPQQNEKKSQALISGAKYFDPLFIGMASRCLSL